VCSIRTLEEFDKYLKIPNCRLYTAWSNDGKMAGYAVEGKGADLQGYIHEWGGGVDAVVALAAHIRAAAGKPVTLISPFHCENIIRKLEELGARRIDGFLGMIKLTNPQPFFNKIIKNAKQEWGINNFVLEQRGQEYYFGLGDNLLKTDQESDIVRILFGPQKPSQFHDSGEQINTVLDKIFPLELWIWGWDSV
jgi:hypothetical protein